MEESKTDSRLWGGLGECRVFAHSSAFGTLALQLINKPAHCVPGQAPREQVPRGKAIAGIGVDGAVIDLQEGVLHAEG